MAGRNVSVKGGPGSPTEMVRTEKSRFTQRKACRLRNVLFFIQFSVGIQSRAQFKK